MTIQQIMFDDLGSVRVAHSDIPLPAPQPGEVSVTPLYLGICGSDLHVLHGKHPWIKPPLVTGHEVVARVIDCADDVSGIAKGDLVALNPLVSCGQCRRCLQGQDNHCEQAKVIGFRLPGAGQTALNLNTRQLHRLPPQMDPRLASLVEPIAVGVHAAQRSDDLEEVLIIGGGTIGLCLLMALGARGAGRITILEPVASKRALALKLGAAAALPPDQLDGAARFTTVFDCVAAQSTLGLGSTATLGGGTLVVVGVPGSERYVNLPRLQRFEIDIHGSGMYIGADMERAIELIHNGSLDVSALITSIVDLKDAAEGYRLAAQPDSVKVLVRMQ
ncbi:MULTISPECIES: zinc-dependent alcohol dehydrogenase [unclassified Pseudomonas]|uniref:zinc-dependent alcohol dehydrogenase n=1 Tax=unclassified Pseudomonas TaxID=196821 RepID=UPI0025FB3621|nr:MULTISPECIES: alcohol dehydrogenase catalytic domain-containing protein [unclassified Pseudomonas]